MRALFIETESTADIKPVIEKAMKLIPKKVGLVTTAQHKHKLKQAKKLIGKGAVIGGQILGCDVSAAKKISKKVDAFLYIGTGEFHPIGIALETGKKVFIANPMSEVVSYVKKEDIDKIRKNEKVSLVKFLSAENVGILVSTKPGQNRLKKALELKKKIKKNCYIFTADEIDFNQFENFGFIDCWINTACPRIADYRTDVINYEMVEKSI